MTANQIITTALRRLGAVPMGDTPEADEATNGLEALNDMLAAWNLDRLCVYQSSAAQYTLQGNKATYTIGKDPTGATVADFDATRPSRIEFAYVIIGGIKHKLTVLYDEQFADIPYTVASIPARLYADSGYPYQKLTLDPFPSTGGYTLELWTWAALPQFPDLTTDFYFPDGYARALKNNLALELAPEYEREPSPSLMRLASESKAAIQNLNIEPIMQRIDPAVILSGASSRQPYAWIGNYR